MRITKRAGLSGQALAASLLVCVLIACSTERRTTSASGGGGGSIEDSDPASLGGEASDGPGGRRGGLGSVSCGEGALRCVSNTIPAQCVGQTWVAQAACDGQAPVCNHGVCGAVGLASNGIAVSGGALSTAQIHLVEHGLESVGTVCGAVSNTQICVTGGIRP